MHPTQSKKKERSEPENAETKQIAEDEPSEKKKKIVNGKKQTKPNRVEENGIVESQENGSQEATDNEKKNKKKTESKVNDKETKTNKEESSADSGPPKTRVARRRAKTRQKLIEKRNKMMKKAPPGRAVIAVPEVNSYLLSSKDLFIVLASDGLWDMLTNKLVVETVHKAFSHAEKYLSMGLGEVSLNEICRDLVHKARDKGANDDITTLLVKLL